MIHDNDKQNTRKHRKMNRRLNGDTSFKGRGILNMKCKWAKRRAK